jgi:hypothetical protein
VFFCPNLFCNQVEAEVAANNRDFPYSGWGFDGQLPTVKILLWGF